MRDAADDASSWRDPDASGPYEAPPTWTPEHVAHRLIEAFHVLQATSSRVGPRRDANGWPIMLQEFADLVDEDALRNAREAFAARVAERHSADEISRMDEALSWPLRFLEGEPLYADAVLVWAYCKAGGFSIAGALRKRVAKAKAKVAVMQAGEDRKIARARKRAILEAGQWRDKAAQERGLAQLPEAERKERWGKLTTGMRNRIDRDLAPLVAQRFEPHHAMPGKILSRTSLDRHLGTALNRLANFLAAAAIPVR